jgi:hypothetical protein
MNCHHLGLWLTKNQRWRDVLYSFCISANTVATFAGKLACCLVSDGGSVVDTAHATTGRMRARHPAEGVRGTLSRYYNGLGPASFEGWCKSADRVYDSSSYCTGASEWRSGGAAGPRRWHSLVNSSAATNLCSANLPCMAATGQLVGARTIGRPVSRRSLG